MDISSMAAALKRRQAEASRRSFVRVKIILENLNGKRKGFAAGLGKNTRTFLGVLRMKAVAVAGIGRQKGQAVKQALADGFQKKLQRLKGISRKKLAAVGIILALVITGAYGTYIYNQGYGYVLVVDGQEIGFVVEDDSPVLESFLAQVKEEAAIYYETDVVMNEKVEIIRDRRPGEHMAAGKVQDELQQNLSFSVYGYSLKIDGLETVVLASEKDFDAVMAIIKDTFVDNGNAILQDFIIHEDLDLEKILVAPDVFSSVEDTANLLLQGTNQRKTYLVSRGDSLYSIARNQNVSLTELQDANPQVEGDLIRPGDELNLMMMVPLVNVSVVEEETVLENIPYETRYVNDNSRYTTYSRVTQEGSRGQKEVTYQITTENGREVDRQVLHVEILKEPVTKVVERGTIRPPFTSTGRFGWPLPTGVGTLTSPFGWRGGSMHYGIDIAASVGTAIRAAESGTVTTSGYRGSYGNLVIINHSNGYSTYYAHNSRNLVSAGQRVSKGETIALVGSTGNSTGPHVHFEIRRNGNPINPMNFFRR